MAGKRYQEIEELDFNDDSQGDASYSECPTCGAVDLLLPGEYSSCCSDEHD